MNRPIEYQTIKGTDGKPAFVVVPYDEFMELYAKEETLIPNEIVGAVIEGTTPIKAWREYLGLTQTDVATTLGITQAAFSQLETSSRPRRSTLRRVASALGLHVEQLAI